MRKIVPVLLVATACGSMPSWSAYQQQIAAFRGHSINDAVSVLGPPTRTVDLAQGHRMYVWEVKSTARTEERYVEQTDPQTHQREIVKEGGDRIPLDCETDIQTDGDGIVTEAKASGLACVALPSAPPAPAAAAVAPSATVTPTPAASVGASGTAAPAPAPTGADDAALPNDTPDRPTISASPSEENARRAGKKHGRTR